jgi:1-acyl-sn-glycerol-3-phosphate acyltransferase
MRIALAGFQGPLFHATKTALDKKGHTTDPANAECLIFFPGSLSDLHESIKRGGFQRLVLRSHAYAYGSNTKNPGLMTEERVSLLPPDVPERKWLQLEECASQVPRWAAIRFTNVVHPDEGDLLVRQLAARLASPLAGHDPNVQFISLEDAAYALVLAAESKATGIFNAAGNGTIPLKKAFRAAGTTRLPIPKPLFHLAGNQSIDQLQYNWTVSGERAARELGFRPESSTVATLQQFLRQKSRSQPGLLRAHYDDYGLDVDYIQAWSGWFKFLRKFYWRMEAEGLENIPASGRSLFISNHRGFMPLDAVMHLYLILSSRQRITRFLIIHSLLKLPFLCNFLTKLGGVIASQENVRRLLDAENLVGVFPEGIRGAFTPYRNWHQLRDFAKSAFARMAVENQAPIIPAVVVGHAEIFPILGRIDWSYLTREYGWPYLPIAPMFPLAPVPIPSKWHVRVLDAVPLRGLKPSDAGNAKLMKEFSRYVQNIMQRNIEDMRAKRRHIFWGKVLDGTAPPVQPFTTNSPDQMRSAMPDLRIILRSAHGI